MYLCACIKFNLTDKCVCFYEMSGELYMPKYRGMPGPRSGSGWVGEWEGEGMEGFWDSIGNVNEENT